MRVLLTRAPEEAARSAAKLAEAGHEALISPVLEMRATGAGWLEGCFDGVLATSARAFEFLPGYADWPPPETRRLMPLYLAGQRTLEAAQRRGFWGPATLAPDAGELAAGLTGQTKTRRLLYLAGRDRKPELEAQLGANGFELAICVIYKAEAAAQLGGEAQNALRDQALDGVLHYSRRSGEIFLKLAQNAGIELRGIKHICISQDTAEPFLQLGCTMVSIAEQPNEQAMLEILESLSHAPV